MRLSRVAKVGSTGKRTPPSVETSAAKTALHGATADGGKGGSLMKLTLVAVALAVMALTPAAQAQRHAKTPKAPPVDCKGKDWAKCFWEDREKQGGG